MSNKAFMEELKKSFVPKNSKSKSKKTRAKRGADKDGNTFLTSVKGGEGDEARAPSAAAGGSALSDRNAEDSDEDSEGGLGIDERDVILYLQRLEEDNLFEMNLLTEEENNLEKMEKESREKINLRRKEIKEVDHNIEMLKQSKQRKQQKIEYYSQILESSNKQDIGPVNEGRTNNSDLKKLGTTRSGPNKSASDIGRFG